MKKLICIASLSLLAAPALAEEQLMPADLDRDPAAIGIAAKKRAYPGGGGYAAFSYNVGYAKAMLQAALASV